MHITVLVRARNTGRAVRMVPQLAENNNREWCKLTGWNTRTNIFFIHYRYSLAPHEAGTSAAASTRGSQVQIPLLQVFTWTGIALERSCTISTSQCMFTLWRSSFFPKSCFPAVGFCFQKKEIRKGSVHCFFFILNYLAEACTVLASCSGFEASNGNIEGSFILSFGSVSFWHVSFRDSSTVPESEPEVLYRTSPLDGKLPSSEFNSEKRYKSD